MKTRLLLAIALLTALAPAGPVAAARCGTFHVTGYNALDPSMADYTADGTYALTTEPIAAAHVSIPFGTVAVVDGLGAFRVADRGRLGPNDLDIRTFSDRDAYAITGEYTVCLR